MLPLISLLSPGASIHLRARITEEQPAVTFRYSETPRGQSDLDGSGTAAYRVATLPLDPWLLYVTYRDITYRAGERNKVSTAIGDEVASMNAQSPSTARRAVEPAGRPQAIADLANPVADTASGSTSLDATNSANAAATPTQPASQRPAAQSRNQSSSGAESRGPAQVTTVRSLGATTAAHALAGLGWSLNPTSQWEFRAAAAAGATHARFQCSWGDAYGGRGGGGELQSPPPHNVSQGYEMPAGCAQGIAYSKQYGLKPTILAAYGPPYEQILTLTLTSAAAAGATSLQVSFASGRGGDSLRTIAYPYDYIAQAGGSGFLSPKHSYAGTLISGIALSGASHATISLASAMQTAVPAGASFIVSRVLYPSIATDTASDPSIRAFAGFVRYLGSQCATARISCEIELWNEPPWPDECWDNRIDCFDSSRHPEFKQEPNGPNWGIAAALQSSTPIPGVTYNWAGTNKSGDNTVLSPSMQQYSRVPFTEPAGLMNTESFHPYGNNPEDNMWSGPCLVALRTVWDWSRCNVISTSSSNASEGAARSILAQRINPSYGIGHSITETGFPGTAGDNAHKARYIVRQFLGFMAANVQYVEFYRMYDTDTTTDFSFVSVSNGTATALPAYTALAGLMSDVAAIKNAPVTSYSTSTLGSVTSYSGSYPLNIVHLVGSRSGDTQNSDFIAVWQMSYLPGDRGWGTLASPAAAPVTITLPTGRKVAQAVNLDTRAMVTYTLSGQRVTFSVSDDPVEVLLEPSSSSAK
jgi:hypothetical protein